MELFHNDKSQSDSLNDILIRLKQALNTDSEITIFTANPQHQKYALRLSIWNDLAECLDCSCALISAEKEKPLELLFRKLDIISFHGSNINEKYGSESQFSNINKLEDPYFLTDLKAALDFIQPEKNETVIDLGCNNGHLFKAFEYWNKCIASEINYIGYDHCPSAIAQATNDFPKKNYNFQETDLNNIAPQDIPSFNILMSIGTLQSTAIDGPEVFKKFYQSGLHKNGKILLAFPNCKYTNSGLLFGARTKNFKTRDMSLLLKDCMYYKKYLQQHGYRVWITGKYYIFLCARKIARGEISD